MMFYMNSKTFEKYFLDIEDDDDILKAQYVIVSTRIRIANNKVDNIINCKNDLFPDPDVCCGLTDDDVRDRYFEQLNRNKALISYLIKGSIEEKFNLIFMCTKKESKIKYLDYLSEYSLIEFGYPIYDYDKYCQNLTVDVEFDEKKVLKKCNKILKEAKNKSIDNMSDQEIQKEIKKLSKAALKGELKKRGLYQKGMDKYTMRDLLEYDIL